MGEGTAAGFVVHSKDYGLHPLGDRVTLKQCNNKVRFVVQIHHFINNSAEWMTGGV